MISIKELETDRFDDFCQYMTIHLSENGQNGINLFFPLSKEQSVFSNDWKEKFEGGISRKIGEIGWRKVWIALNQDNSIVGHIDIRSHNQLNTEHRVLLGMGVDSKFRNKKIGLRLYLHDIECRELHEIISPDR